MSIPATAARKFDLGDDIGWLKIEAELGKRLGSPVRRLFTISRWGGIASAEGEE
jgi:hypothetical protein